MWTLKGLIVIQRLHMFLGALASNNVSVLSLAVCDIHFSSSVFYPLL